MEEREYIIVQLQLNVKNGHEYLANHGWVDVDTDDFDQVIKTGNKFISKQVKHLKKQHDKLKMLGTYQMIVTGTEKDYWTRTGIDLKRFQNGSEKTEHAFKLTDFETDNNLTMFTKELFRSKRIRGDILKNLRVPTSIYGLGENRSEEIHKLPNAYLLNLSIENHNSDDISWEDQNKKFRMTASTVIYNFGRLLVFIAKMVDLYNEEYLTNHDRSNEIHEKALKLQKKINELIMKKSEMPSKVKKKKKPSKSEAKRSVKFQKVEEELLLKASRNFSQLTEINQILARANNKCQEMINKIEKLIQTMGLTPITLMIEPDKEISSLSLEFNQLIDSINLHFQNLKVELEQSQSTIRNTVDILKTFLESEQRTVSQKSGEAISWIVIVFAGLGLADALGNFVIFWLQGGSGFQAMFWFLIIMIILIIVIVTLYFWYFKRPKIQNIYGV